MKRNQQKAMFAKLNSVQRERAKIVIRNDTNIKGTRIQRKQENKRLLLQLSKKDALSNQDLRKINNRARRVSRSIIVDPIVRNPVRIALVPTGIPLLQERRSRLLSKNVKSVLKKRK